ANIVCRMSPEKGIYFGKAVSLGNECDLNSADFLTYYAEDDETKVIGAYIEGICNSRYFLSALKETASRKPVIIWKVGLTSEGSKAASSHTGALASTPEIWDGVIQQTGAIPAVGFENWVDLLMGFTHFPPGLGERTAIISGPGGLAVSAAEACGHAGLKLAELSPETIDNLSKFVPLTGTSLKNPIDVGMSASLDIDIYIQSARIAAEDPNIDAVFMIGIGFSNEDNTRLAEALIQTRRELNKPIAMINVPGFDRNLAQLLCESSVPFFESAERAMSTYSAVRNYQQWKDRVE
ncbi:hypothetical protein KKA14_16125, partial [bacterium]|nr:hypothetical protein [bacterium]